MSRLTGNDAKGLMEAYSAVYTPQQITEEQIWEEVENWVNSLLEEGYDLSDYTWEEMYEEYIAERSNNDPYGVAPGTPRVTSGNKGPNIGKFFGFGSPAKPNQGRTNVDPYGVAPRRPATAAAAPAARPAAAPAARPAAAPAARPSGAPAAAAKPAPSAAAKPAPSAAAGPAAAGPAIGKLGSTSFERRTPTSTELKAAQAARAGGANPEKALQAAKAAGTTAKIQAAGSEYGSKAFKPSSDSVVKTTSNIAAAKTLPTVRPAGSSKPGSRFEDLDLFDVIKGHLLDEGYADTEESALAIMSNMSEEWRSTILEKEGDGRPMDNIEKSPGDPGFNAPPPAKNPKYLPLKSPPAVK